MKRVFILISICCQILKLYSQDLELQVAGKKFSIISDTIHITKEHKAVSFKIFYTISKTSVPVSLKITDGAGFTIPLSSILCDSNFLTMQSLSPSNNFQGYLNLVLPANESYADYEYVNMLFVYPDLLNPGSHKKKLLIVAIHKRESFFDSVNDPTNTTKLEMIQYTDFLGINSDRPNGGLQQQLLFKWPINRRRWQLSKHFSLQPLRSVLLPNVLLNRIDKARDDSSMLVPLGGSVVRRPNSVENDTITNVVGTFDLIRYTNTMIESSLNILTVHFENTRVYLNFDFGLLRNRVLDSLSQARLISRPIYSVISGWHAYAKSTLDPKTQLNIEIEVGFKNVRLKDNFYKQYDVFGYESGEVNGIRFPVKTIDGENKSRPIYYSSVKLSKDWGKESTNYIFLRLKYQWQNGEYNFIRRDAPKELRMEAFHNHFFQVNLGLSLGLESLFKK